MFKRGGNGKANGEMLLMTAPILIKLLLFSYLPMFGIVLAFKELHYAKGIWGSDWVGFRNFEFFFRSVDAWRITRNTLLMNSLFIVASVVVSVLLAVLLYNIGRSAFLKTYQTAMFFPYFLSWVVVATILEQLIGSNGFLNGLAASWGWAKVDYYGQAALWPIILVFSFLWKTAGYSAILYYSILVGTDPAHTEAAMLEGANRRQLIWHIQIPSLRPMIALNVILAIGQIFNADFGMFYFLPGGTGNRAYETTDVVDTYVFRALIQLGDMSMGAAVGLFQAVVGFALVLLTNYIVKRSNPDYRLF